MLAKPSSRVFKAKRCASLSPYLLTENRRFLTTPGRGLQDASQNSYSNPVTFLRHFLTPTVSFFQFLRFTWAYSRLVSVGYSSCRVFARDAAALKHSPFDA